MTISTSPDQTAVAPGNLKREWAEKGRRYFRYELDRPIVNFWSVLSARYAIAKDRWNDVELSVFHHPSHSANLPALFEGLKLALTYASEAFGTYRFSQLRVVEFPYSNFAQSFPGTLPFSENAALIGRKKMGQNQGQIVSTDFTVLIDPDLLTKNTDAASASKSRFVIRDFAIPNALTH